MQDSHTRPAAAAPLPRTLRSVVSAAVALALAAAALPAEAQSSRSSQGGGSGASERTTGTAGRSAARPASSVRASRAREHEVASGESLWSISRRYHVSVDALKEANGLGSSSTIRPGRKLRIPSAAAEHAVAAAERREAHEERTARASRPAARPASSTAKKSGSVPARAALRVGSSRRVEREALLGRMVERRLVLPVVGIEPSRLRDSYDEARSEGRIHDAIDIHAPRGTPVVAVADGRVLRFHEGARGGRSIYLLDDDGRTRYYYAHLDRYEDGLGEGDRVEQGQVIGYVGDTGNAQPGDYHLHFSIAVLSNPGRWWQGDNLNPYPLLREAEPVEAR